MSEIRDHIESLVAKRQACWREGTPATSVEEELAKAYDKLRRSQAAGLHGSPDEILRQARVERQLEKLMSSDEE